MAVLACLLIGSCATQRPAPPVRPEIAAAAGSPLEHPDLAAVVLAAHNAERARRRLTPVTLDAELTCVAQTHAADMARRAKLSHRGGDGSSPFERIERTGYTYRAAAENVAAGYDQVDAVMAGWLRSPGHRRNILGPYNAIGVGRATASNGVSYWCVTLATPARRDFR